MSPYAAQCFGLTIRAYGIALMYACGYRSEAITLFALSLGAELRPDN